MLRLAAQAPRRRRPVTSTLGVMNSVSAATASASAVGPGPGTVGALRQHDTAVSSTVFSLGNPVTVHSSGTSPASARVLRRQEGLVCAHVLRRSREPVAVTRSANSAFAAPRHLQPLAAGRIGLSSTHPVRFARRPAFSAVGAPGRQGRQLRCVCKASARSTPGMPPNMAVNRSANGMAPGPRSARCPCCASRPRHHAVVARLPLR